MSVQLFQCISLTCNLYNLLDLVMNARNANLDIVEQYETYEDYLDSQLTPTDLDYLEDEELARQLVELGYRGLGDTLHRDVSRTFGV